MKRRFLVLLLSAVLLISVLGVAALAQEPASVYEQSCYQHGDINNDGKIDSQDAIYTLFHAIPMFQEQYPIDQDCDFNKDTVVNSKDAIHLLFAADPEHASEYPLDGTVHRYFEPVWEWNADAEGATAKATLNCGCGDKHEITDITITTGHLEEADCVSTGSKEYVGRFIHNGKLYIGTYTVELPAGNGHSFDEFASCEEPVKCDFCDAEKPATGHTWVLNAEKSTAATCTKKAVQWYDCACGANQQVEVEGYADHQYAPIDSVLVTGSTCEYKEQFKCQAQDCGHVMDGEHFFKHQYTVTLTKEADCTNYGEKTYTCTLCGDSYTEAVDPNGVHKWDAGVEANGVITHTCTVDGCGATQTAVSVQNDEAVSKDTLLNTDKVTLEGGASVSLDDATVNALSGDVKLSVEEADLTGVSIEAEKLAQIGNNKVYDFKLSDGTGNKTEFGGAITVSLPYVLADGEDIDSIDVWYIADNGELKRMEGTYSNGYVTFTTTHFSYYTVTRLTPAERCERYGHINVTSQSQATCTQDGYTLNVCQRCGHSEKTDVVGKSGHNYQDTENCRPAGCTEEGLKEQKCVNCSDVQSQVLPATGHTMVKDEEQSYGATCTAAGAEHYACACGFHYDVELSQKPHEYVSEEIVQPSCDSKGYEKFGCKTCDKEVIRNEKAALGHAYAPAANGWTWSEDHKTATLKLVCGNNSSHEKVISATVTEKTENSVCLGGAVTYTATVSFNMNTYTDTVTATEAGKGHVPSNRWVIENDRHYRICVVCGENADVGAHTYGEKTVTKEPTCVETGLATQTCTVCGHEKATVVDATGVHNYVNGVCDVCGVRETGCLHIPNQLITYDLSQYGACGGEIVWRTCSCGKVVEQENHHVYCVWDEPVRTEEKLPNGATASVFTHTCELCGLQWTYKDFSIDDKTNCTASWYEIDQMSIGGAQIYSVELKYYEQNHPMHVQGETVDLKDYGLCGGLLVKASCYCGKAYASYQPDAEGGCNWVDDEETGNEICSVCGAICVVESKAQESGCDMIVTATRTFMLNGKAVYTENIQQVYDNHQYEIEDYKMHGATCEDGVTVVSVCAKCGDTEEYTTASHIHANEQVIDLSGYDMCGGKLIISTCICSEARKDFYFEGNNHQWSHDYWSEDHMSATCVNCGTKWTQETVFGEKDADCHAVSTEKHTWTDKSGNQFKAERTGETELHDFTISAKLKGQSCDDGVTATYTCADCGFVRVENYNGHRVVTEGVCDLSEYGGCNSIIEWQTCACKQYTYWGWREHNCEYYHVTGDENSVTMKCSKCGITRYEAQEELGKIDSCHRKVRETYKFSKDGVELLAFSFTPIVENHNILSEVTLHEGATTCADGYHVKHTCLTCGEVTSENDSYSEHHETYAVKQELISQGQLCGDLYLVTYRCACGQNEHTGPKRVNGQCEYVHQGVVNGYEVLHCNKCGVTQKMRGFQEPIEGETCQYRMITNYVFTKDGVTIAACDVFQNYTEHRYEHTFQLNGTSCEEGYTATGVCALCGDTTTWSTGDEAHHESMAVEHVDLASYGACGGTMTYYSCACGQETHVEHYDMKCRMKHTYSSETDLNGVRHEYTTDVCRKCGLEITEERYNVKGEGCTMEEHTVRTYRLGDKLNKSFTTVYTWESHDAEPYAVSLMEGAQNCEDGVIVYYRCKDCGYEYEGRGSSHYRVAVSTEDLSAYGSVCGGKLELTKCACGEHIGYEFSDDTKCDLHEQQIENWIEGALNDYQYTTEGGVGVWSDSYLYVCPVTDPQCHLTIRMSRYWLKEGCEAVEYEIWQLGYNEEDGTCQKELKIATGERVGFHAYEHTRKEETLSDNTVVSVDSYVCPDCQSTYTEKLTFVDGIMAKREVTATNTLNNGERKQMDEIEEHGLVYENYRFLTSRHYSFVDADGTAYWQDYSFSYDPADLCWRTVTWTDSDGDGNTYGESSHHTEREYESVKKATCSQHGEDIERYICVVCDAITHEYRYDIEPNAHYWERSEDLQTYVCWRCGLESDNPSSGSIVLEDLSEAYGNGTNYVIGYWNRGEVAINPYVSVILNDIEGDVDNERVLEGIEFKELTVANDGVRALAFNKADIQGKAAEAIANAGYTGSYAIRISFVPTGAEGELDYAITLDSQMAE